MTQRRGTVKPRIFANTVIYSMQAPTLSSHQTALASVCQGKPLLLILKINATSGVAKQKKKTDLS